MLKSYSVCTEDIRERIKLKFFLNLKKSWETYNYLDNRKEGFYCKFKNMNITTKHW